MSIFEKGLQEKREKLIDEMTRLEDEIATRQDEYEGMEDELKELDACLGALNDLKAECK